MNIRNIFYIGKICKVKLKTELKRKNPNNNLF